MDGLIESAGQAPEKDEVTLSSHAGVLCCERRCETVSQARARTWVPSAASLSSSAWMHFMRSVAYRSGS